MMRESPSQQHYRTALLAMLENPLTRVLLWRIIAEDCKVFEESFALNASAYCLLAKQEIGKRLLADAKRVSPDLVVKAENEYNLLMEQNTRYLTEENEDGEQ